MTPSGIEPATFRHTAVPQPTAPPSAHTATYLSYKPLTNVERVESRTELLTAYLESERARLCVCVRLVCLFARARKDKPNDNRQRAQRKWRMYVSCAVAVHVTCVTVQPISLSLQKFAPSDHTSEFLKFSELYFVRR